jgi:hypothetical protein
MFRKGLKSEVKDELMRWGLRIDELGPLVELACTIGDRLYERSIERKYKNKTGAIPIYRNTPNIGRFRMRPRDPDAIEIDNL